MQNKLEREVKNQSWLGEIREGGEGLHWVMLLSKKKKVLYKVFAYWCYKVHFQHMNYLPVTCFVEGLRAVDTMFYFLFQWK
jgi:hypothetical protein